MVNCGQSDTTDWDSLFRCNEMIAATQSLTIQETSMKIQAIQAKEVGAAWSSTSWQTFVDMIWTLLTVGLM
jgi:hypothetical protein